jgi:hypothetical protein
LPLQLHFGVNQISLVQFLRIVVRCTRIIEHVPLDGFAFATQDPRGAVAETSKLLPGSINQGATWLACRIRFGHRQATTAALAFAGSRLASG